jgi:carboxylate-amine ligase
MRVYERAVIAENKFRALKKGLDGKMIDFSLKEERPTRALLGEIFDFVEDTVDELGVREQMNFLRAWAAHGDTGADRQVSAFERTQDLRAVVDLLVDETKRGL